MDAAVVRATGISESTVLRGLADLESEERPAPGNVRRHPGRTPILEREPGLAEDLERLVDPVTQGRSGVAVAVDVEERREARGGVAGDGSRCRGADRAAVVEGQGVQPAGEQEDAGGRPASRSRRAVSAHQRDRQRGARGGRAGDQRGRQEARADRRFQGGRPRVSSPRAGRSRSAATTSRTSSSGTRSRTASTTWPPTRDGSASGSPATPRSSRSTRSSAGGSTSARTATRTPRR